MSTALISGAVSKDVNIAAEGCSDQTPPVRNWGGGSTSMAHNAKKLYKTSLASRAAKKKGSSAVTFTHQWKNGKFDLPQNQSCLIWHGYPTLTWGNWLELPGMTWQQHQLHQMLPYAHQDSIKQCNHLVGEQQRDHSGGFWSSTGAWVLLSM